MNSPSGVCGPAENGSDAGEVGECVADGKADDTAEELIEDEDDGVYVFLVCIAADDENDAVKSHCCCCDEEVYEGEVAWEDVEATGEACIDNEAIDAGV